MRNYQPEAVREILKPNSRNILCVSRRGGKDYTGLMAADIMCTINPGSNIGYLGVSIKALRKILTSNDYETGKPMWTSVIDTRKIKGSKQGKFLNRDTTSFEYKNGSIIYLLGSDQNNEIGTSLNLLIVTEAARFSLSSWKYLRGNVEGAQGGILMISSMYFASEFNQIIEGDHEESGLWNQMVYPADTIRNPDGSLVFPPERLERIRAEFGPADFDQEFMCSTNSASGDSILGRSLKLNEPVNVDYSGDNQKLYFSFDLGNADETVLFVWYEDTKTRIPVMIDYMIQNETNLEDFIHFIKMYACRFNDPYMPITIILPFDADNDFQGYAGKLNRKKEIEKNIPKTWNVVIINQMRPIRLLQIVRRLFETNRIGIVNDSTGSQIRKILASITKKRNVRTDKIMAPIDKRSGLHGDHPYDSVKYFCAYRFKDMFTEDYDTKMIDTIIQGNRFTAPNFSKGGINVQPIKYGGYTR